MKQKISTFCIVILLVYNKLVKQHLIESYFYSEDMNVFNQMGMHYSAQLIFGLDEKCWNWCYLGCVCFVKTPRNLPGSFVLCW